jgi:tellurite resistance protein
MDFSRRLAFALALTLTGAAFPRVAAAQTTPGMPATASAALATIHQFMDGLNAGDMKRTLAACAPQASIVDEVPPHEWQGTNACAKWAHDLDAADKAAGITDGVVTLGTPWRIDVNGTRAYAVVPATYAFKVHGRTVTETNSIFTAALVRVGGAWRITGWAWSAH